MIPENGPGSSEPMLSPPQSSFTFNIVNCDISPSTGGTLGQIPLTVPLSYIFSHYTSGFTIIYLYFRLIPNTNSTCLYLPLSLPSFLHLPSASSVSNPVSGGDTSDWT